MVEGEGGELDDEEASHSTHVHEFSSTSGIGVGSKLGAASPTAVNSSTANRNELKRRRE